MVVEKQALKHKIFLISEILLLVIGFFLLVNKHKLAVQSFLYITYFVVLIIVILMDFFTKYVKKIILDKLDLIMFTLRTIISVLFIILFFVSIRTVSGKSMEPTLDNGDKIFLYHLSYKPSVNDIIVFEASKNNDYVKRIYALEGDKLEFRQEEDEIYYVYINNTKVVSSTNKYYALYLDQYDRLMKQLNPYLNDGKITKGYYFVLGDNATNSQDSRSLGLIHHDDIIGKVLFKK